MDSITEEVEAVQSIFAEELQHKADGSRHMLTFTMNGQLILTITLDGKFTTVTTPLQ